VAHDFNNVLGIILGLTLARRRLDEPGVKSVDDAHALARVLEHIELAARRGAAVCRKLLNFSRRDITHAETFDSVEALSELEPLLRQLLPPNVQLSIDSAVNPLPIHFDRSEFELALLNLASNARDAMPDGGTCTISLAQEEAATVALCIQDTGVGMSEAVRSRIFEPFFTTKAVGSGTGLGLSVVYGLVRRAGGEISVGSVPGQGTRFRISLPIAMAPVTNVPLPLLETRPRVLLIDDDDDLRALLVSTLRSGGCEVSEAANGAEAERLAEAMQRPPHVLVCDHTMPDTDGATLLRKLREKLPHVPAILISAYLDTDGSSAHPADPFNERLPKPFSPDTLLARVRAIASLHRSIAEPDISAV
jgi:CheY-like chemotaxis protein